MKCESNPLWYFTPGQMCQQPPHPHNGACDDVVVLGVTLEEQARMLRRCGHHVGRGQVSITPPEPMPWLQELITPDAARDVVLPVANGCCTMSWPRRPERCPDGPSVGCWYDDGLTITPNGDGTVRVRMVRDGQMIECDQCVLREPTSTPRVQMVTGSAGLGGYSFTVDMYGEIEITEVHDA